MTYREVLSIRPFRNLWLGQAISQLGDSLYYLSFMFMVSRITGSAEMVGFVGAVEVLPYILLSPAAGVVADRVDRRTLMLVSDLSRAMILAVLALFVAFDASPPIAVIFASAFSLSAVSVFFNPARGAAVPALVPADKLQTANSLSSATQSFMPLIGLGLSGGVLGAVYHLFPTLFFLMAIVLNMVSFLVSAVYIWKLPALRPVRSGPHSADSAIRFSEGVGFILKHRVLLWFIGISMAVSLLVSPFFVVYVTANNQWYGQPVFPGADHIFGALASAAAFAPGASPTIGSIKSGLMPGAYTTLAFLELAFVAGMLIGSIWVGKVRIVRIGWAFALNLAFVGATIMALYWYHQFWQFFALNLVAGVSLPFAQVPAFTYQTLAVPDGLRGRVNSIAMMASTIAMPAGMGLAGIMIERIGLNNMFLVMGSGLFMGLPALLDPAFRRASLLNLCGQDLAQEGGGDISSQC